MFRKTILALGATVALAAAALAPTSASAFGHGHGGHGFRGPGIALGVLGLGVLAAAAYDAPRDCYIVRRVVRTPYGPEVRKVEVCD
jgi:hypothetical protein